MSTALLPYRLYPRLDWRTMEIRSRLEWARGMTTEMGTEWWTDEQWEEHRRYVAGLVEKGEYGTLDVYWVQSRWHEPMDGPAEKVYDRNGYPIPQPLEKPLSHYRMLFLDRDESNGEKDTAVRYVAGVDPHATENHLPGRVVIHSVQRVPQASELLPSPEFFYTCKYPGREREPE